MGDENCQEGPAHLAARMPRGAYRFETPPLRCPLKYAWVRQDARTVPLQAFLTPEDNVLSIHASTFHVQTWVEGKLVYDGKVLKDSISLVPRGAKSEVSLLGEIDILQVFLPKETLVEASTEIFGAWREPRIDGFVSNGQIVNLMRQAAHATECIDHGALLVADVMGFEALRHVVTRFADDPTKASRAGQSLGGLAPFQLRRAVEMMEAALGSELRVTELSSALGISPFHFIRAFTTSTGLPPHRWLARRRTALAKQLLARGLDLEEVARQTGYATPKSFSAAFKRATGAPPKRWNSLVGSLSSS